MDPKIVAAVVTDLKLGAMTQREIADKHGIACGTVTNIRQRAKIPARIAGASKTPIAEQPEPRAI